MGATEANGRGAEVIGIIDEVTRDWETGFNGSVTVDTTLVEDLGFESIDMVQLVTAIEQRFNRRDLPFEQLMMEDGRYKSDFTVGEIVSFLDEHL